MTIHHLYHKSPQARSVDFPINKIATSSYPCWRSGWPPWVANASTGWPRPCNLDRNEVLGSGRRVLAPETQTGCGTCAARGVWGFAEPPAGVPPRCQASAPRRPCKTNGNFKNGHVAHFTMFLQFHAITTTKINQRKQQRGAKLSWLLLLTLSKSNIRHIK
jgi:hypothetical protein